MRVRCLYLLRCFDWLHVYCFLFHVKPSVILRLFVDTNFVILQTSRFQQAVKRDSWIVDYVDKRNAFSA
jgi:hypothetical protein